MLDLAYFRGHLDEIEDLWSQTLQEWIDPERIPDFNATVDEVGRRLRALKLD